MLKKLSNVKQLSVATATVGLMTLGATVAHTQAANAAAIISNGVIQIGVNDEGHLNIPGGTPSSGVGTTTVGLRFLPTGAEFTAPGLIAEGWGVADAASGLTGYANVDIDGVQNLDLVSFTATSTTATSVVSIDDVFLVTHDYKPSSETPFLYDVEVTIENISSSSVDDVRYRRVMDWDIEPTAFREFVTIQGTEEATNVLFASDDGFASANPLSSRSSRLFTGDAVDSGPSDHGALFDFGFGSLGSGDSKSFNIFYGGAFTEVEALAALGAVGAEVYSLGQADVPGGADIGSPNTGIFAFSGVGGVSMTETPTETPEPVSILALLTLGALGTTSLKRRQKEEK
ncbi:MULTISPECIES: PEP-CTERM sorting domain-containing protein [Okeania]|uniref:PEP-CTERM sorting domain-containing protein n=1 Tax=Okeania hirsuta TaxID=1458930 RepID=A0A3N6PFH8_9CYAN|nr:MULTISPECIES: PEP-CTERM sorting domain-containing protein [Okeania]NES87953.1 PEP-CTERM sorting domain-containing protein [Okeania sp. SIO2B9]NET76413.1 PEP-CTERM sorting domain-containing protein [Okeania sp. SIO1F9]RQH48258.1 PEP-CTERM sorting domain-containing protein [Okeania hirsuta]